MADEFTLRAASSHCLDDRVSGDTERTQHGTVLEDWYITRTDKAAACSCPAVAWPGISLFLVITVESHRFRTVTSEKTAQGGSSRVRCGVSSECAVSIMHPKDRYVLRLFVHPLHNKTAFRGEAPPPQNPFFYIIDRISRLPTNHVDLDLHHTSAV